MPSQDDRVSSRSGPVPVPGLKRLESFAGPQVIEDGLTRPLPTLSSRQDQVPSTDPLPAFGSAPGQFTNANLTRVLTTTLPRVSENSTSQRIPVVIKGSPKKRVEVKATPASHRKRRLAVTLVGVLMLVLVTGLTLYSVAPLGRDRGLSWNPLAQPANSMFTSQNTSQPKLLAQATATAVFHRQTDGYSGGGAQTIGNGAGSLNWPYGQCTYWANARYHQLTNIWVSWSGNADQWVTGARMAGWNVSTQPHVPSIIVLMPYVQLASGYGHVAVVENIVSGVSPVTVNTSNMNWFNNGGGWGIKSYQDFTVGSGVYFIWHK